MYKQRRKVYDILDIYKIGDKIHYIKPLKPICFSTNHQV
jgi:hypothetical protein